MNFFIRELQILFWQSLGWNIVGAIAIMAWALVMSAIVFGMLYFLGVLRVHPTIEVNGKSHNVLIYRSMTSVNMHLFMYFDMPLHMTGSCTVC